MLPKCHIVAKTVPINRINIAKYISIAEYMLVDINKTQTTIDKLSLRAPSPNSDQ